MAVVGTQSWHERLWRVWNSIVNGAVRAVRVTPDSPSQFGETRVAERTAVIELNSSYGTSKLRDVEETSGSSAITKDGGALKLATGTTNASVCTLKSAEVGRYIPGYGAQIGIGVQVPAALTGDAYVEWGGESQDAGDFIGFGRDAQGLYVKVTRNDIDTVKVYQSAWNIDNVDGTGESGVTLNPANGNIYEIDFTWYGYGQILFNVVQVITDSYGSATQRTIPVHSYVPAGATSLASPNLRLRAVASNGTTGVDTVAYVGGRQYSIVGRYEPKFRFTHDYRGSVSTTSVFVPLVSMKRKAAFGDRSVKLEGLDLIAVSEPHIVEVRLDPTLTDATFGNPTGHDATETALESDTSATAVTGGTVVWQQIVAAGTNVNRAALAEQQVNFDTPNGATVTLCARTFSGNGSIISGLRMREEW